VLALGSHYQGLKNQSSLLVLLSIPCMCQVYISLPKLHAVGLWKFMEFKFSAMTLEDDIVSPPQ